MARIRREDKTEYSRTEPFWNVGLYIRLSREDENREESESILNQEKILRDFAAGYFQPGTYAIADVFSDDGLTGTDTDRPDFQRLTRCIIRGEVNCVIVKSLARGFRNLADQQKFLEEFMPLHNARFICTGTPFIDTYADPYSARGLEVPIRGMFNEQFAAATSEEIRKTFRMKRERGEFIGAFAVYGYRKDPEDKNRLLVDEEAAEVVKNIYRWFVNEGYSKAGIAKKLNQMGEPNPGAYKRQKGLKYSNPNSGKNDGLWSAGTIARILRNRTYTGAMVQGRSRVISYKVHKQRNVPEREWSVVPGTHEAIIDSETFEKAQMLHRRDTRAAPGRQQVYLLSGFVRCADCRKAMRRKTARNIAYYSCRSYTDKKICSKHSIRQDRLENVILTVLQMLIALADPIDGEIGRISAVSAVSRETERLSSSLKEAERQQKKYLDFSDSLYFDWKNGEITREEYRRLKMKSREQIERMKTRISCLKDKIRKEKNGGKEEDPYLENFLKYGNIRSLNRGILTELIKEVRVHKGGEITIDLNFSDGFRRIAGDAGDECSIFTPEGKKKM